jgi:SAM-dependent methyltransferase
VTRLPGDVVVLPEPDGRWRLVNVFARTSLVVESAGLEVARAAEGGDLAARFAGETFAVWEASRFTHEDGLLADPTRFERDPAAWGAAEQLDAGALADRLRERLLLIDDEAAYRARFADKTSLLDGEHFGTFHQQLGQHLLLVRREDPDEWWLAQKFEDDLRAIRDTLYRAVQATGLERWAGERLRPGDRVVDLGCGTGVFSNLMARSGADVLGVDPSERFVAIARETAEPTARFEVRPVSEPGALDAIASDSADVVFMSDALLFYFVPAAPGQQADLDVLLADVRRILRPGGRFVSVEPNYLFWLAPWLGDADRPFTILIEHQHRAFSVTPTPAQLLSAVLARGFHLVAADELTPDPAFAQVDARAHAFAAEFPVWQRYEFTPAPAP